MLELRFPDEELDYNDDNEFLLKFYIVNTTDDSYFDLDTFNFDIDYPVAVTMHNPDDEEEKVLPMQVSLENMWKESLYPHEAIGVSYLIKRKNELDEDEEDEFRLDVNIKGETVNSYQVILSK